MNIQYGPIKQWPGKLRDSHQRIRAPFKSDHTSTIRLLEKELRIVGAESPVVQLAIREDQWTRDGRPYAKAQAAHPGVIVSFVKAIRRPTGVQRIPLSFPCDRFTTWETNLRAVAIALEDLRRIDRYGVTQNAEQYTGFKSLPPPGPTHDQILTVEDAARFLAVGVSGCLPDHLLAHPDNVRRAYREKAAVLHPDANGGIQRPEWGMLQAAKTLLDQHHGI